jgi:hypothetical protein
MGSGQRAAGIGSAESASWLREAIPEQISMGGDGEMAARMRAGRQDVWRDTASGAFFFLCHGAHVRSGWVSMPLPLLCPALPCPTLALPCSCTALARDTDTPPLRYASLAIRQCQLWRAGCLPSELDHFARACVSPRPAMDSTAISKAIPLPNVTARQVSQMYRQAAADRAEQRRRVARRRRGARRLSAAAGRRVASTARGDCKVRDATLAWT